MTIIHKISAVFISNGAQQVEKFLKKQEK